MFYKNLNIIINVLILFIILAPYPRAFARFNHLDAGRVDAEERNNTETYNDKNSYRYPRAWDEAWAVSQFGYRSSAGSLNASRFCYQDDLVIAPNPDATLTASFTQWRREDLVEQSAEREMRLGWAIVPNLRLAILGDGDTFKEYGDIGASLLVQDVDLYRLDVYYWNVDNYYKSKKTDPDSYRLRDSQTVGVKLGLGPQTRPKISLQFEVDSPLDWHYPGAGFEYEYWRKYADLRWEWPITQFITGYWATQYELKKEKKTSLTLQGVSKYMLRRHVTVELGFDHEAEQDISYRFAVQNIKRSVDYENGVIAPNDPAWRESRSPEIVRRAEWAVLASRYGIINERLALQHGLYANEVSIKENEREWKNLEVKYQFFLDVSLNKNSKLGINTTWDIDQLIRDFPYPKNAPFRPWGGGDLKFLMQI